MCALAALIFYKSGNLVSLIFHFHRRFQGEASWTRPESALTVPSSDDGGSSQLAITNGLEDGSNAGSANEWVSYIDEDTEQAYWYNVRTGETSWA